MGRNKRQNRMEKENFKTLVYLSGAVIAIALVTFAITYFIYSGKVAEQESSILDTTQIASLPMNDTKTESASTQIGKTVAQAQNEMAENTVKNTVENTISKSNTVSKSTNTTSTKNTTNNTVTNTVKSTNTTKSTNTVSSKSNNTVATTPKSEEKKEEAKKQLSFAMPVEGEIMTKYAKDNLVFSETLQEWITHLGIDIKADKATVVKAAEAGTVDTIKNDPRYGLTVIVTHEDGFKTVYSNLLTAEFVSEGEKVTKGQTLGTVGNSAAFEITEDAHLHFELWKNDESVDPTAYFKD